MVAIAPDALAPAKFTPVAAKVEPVSSGEGAFGDMIASNFLSLARWRYC